MYLDLLARRSRIPLTDPLAPRRSQINQWWSRSLLKGFIEYPKKRDEKVGRSRADFKQKVLSMLKSLCANNLQHC
jgi:hypothetical protein